ncbi:putative alpha-1,2-mannosidase [Mucilaginibacter sp. UYNi724]
MKKLLLIAALLVASETFAQQVNTVSDPVEWINPLMGTDSKFELSNGNTYPAVALPWGMNTWVAQTGGMGDGWIYTYDAHKIRGFKQTHQPSPWMNDYGQFSIMPLTKHYKVTENERASWFSHKAEVAKPYYYSVYLADHDITTEITPTERSAQFRFTFPESDSSFIVIDALDKASYVKIIPGQNKIIGYSTKYSRGPLPNFKNYFVIYLDKPFTVSRTYRDSVLTDSLELHSNRSLAVIGFKTSAGEKVHLRVASSFISFEQAEQNLRREQGNDSFDVTKQKAKNTWNKTLRRITVAGGSVDQTRTFYSCLYRMLFFPNKLYEINGENKIIHWSPYTGKTEQGYLFAGTGFWDTFRALYPFLNLVYPSMDKEMQEGLINAYKEGGWLPEWSSPGYADIMIGNNSASVVADAYLKGIRGYNIDKLYEALLHGANNAGPNATGRKGVEYYNALGFVPRDKIGESAARTLEYAYDDFSIYRLGKALNRPAAETDIYKKRSLNYKNVFDPSTGFMRGKNQDGTFETPFNPYRWGGAFIEGNSWHYTWSVFHDVQGLINLVGGSLKFAAKLDSVFTAPPMFGNKDYNGGIIHEMREMQVVHMGQYAHGNQPIQHMIYLYNYAGMPWKTQYRVREAMEKLYMATPDGYCGDEDNGQTSAWYVFSAMGFYPVCPTSNQYVLGSPLFKSITLNLENGKKLILNAPNNSSENKYISRININGKIYNKNWLDHDALLKGGLINFTMSPQPNKQRGAAAENSPYSLSNEK